MQVIREAQALTAWAEQARAEGLRIGFVPTMGFLHAGHLSLMRLLRSQVDRLVVSIYVNPLQFGPNEDLESYPRDEQGDLDGCGSVGADVVFIPDDLYPDGFSTSVSVHQLTNGLCGEKRPGHFEGVATVVTRLFGVTRCHVAAFGEKDYQQLCVIRRMVRDLALPVEVIGGPIVREPDGLAMSSRNTYLTDSDRRRALSLNRSLHKVLQALKDGEINASKLIALGRSELEADRVDYFEIVDAESLIPLDVVRESARVLVAAFIGGTRLIDNMAMEINR